jgi:hypothetical protein
MRIADVDSRSDIALETQRALVISFASTIETSCQRPNEYLERPSWASPFHRAPAARMIRSRAAATAALCAAIMRLREGSSHELLD